MKYFVFLFFSLWLVSTALADAVEDRYTATLKVLQAGDRTAALNDFRAMAKQYPRHTLTGNFHFWAGEALSGLKRYEEAAAEYTLACMVKYTNKEADARYKLGICYAQLGKEALAKQEWERFLRDFPDHPLAASAKKRLQ